MLTENQLNLNESLLLPAETTAVLFSASLLSFFPSVNTITHEPLHLASWNFARTCTLTTSESILNIKVIGQRSRSHGSLCAWHCLNQLAWIHEMLHKHGLWAVLSLEQGLPVSVPAKRLDCDNTCKQHYVTIEYNASKMLHKNVR